MTDSTRDIPAGACDCHVHVFGPAHDYPMDPARHYTPGDATLDALRAHLGSLGLDRCVIVQPSPYGADNRCTVDALHALEGAGRGVAVISDATTADELHTLHDAGVRGVRVNLETAGRQDPAWARRQLVETAARVAPLGWHVQTYTNLMVLGALADVLPTLPVPLVVDHFGRAQASLGVGQAHFDVLLDGLSRGRLYVKLSAAYRISTQPDYADATAIAQALINTNPDRVLWGSDWPHPGTAAGVPLSTEGITPFRPEDNRQALLRARHWTQTPERLHKLLVDNPARLYDF